MSKRFKQFECDVEEANELIEKEKYPFISEEKLLSCTI